MRAQRVEVEQIEFFSEAELESLEFVLEELEAIETERVPDLDTITFEDIAEDLEAIFMLFGGTAEDLNAVLEKKFIDRLKNLIPGHRQQERERDMIRRRDEEIQRLQQQQREQRAQRERDLWRQEQRERERARRRREAEQRERRGSPPRQTPPDTPPRYSPPRPSGSNRGGIGDSRRGSGGG